MLFSIRKHVIIEQAGEEGARDDDQVFFDQGHDQSNHYQTQGYFECSEAHDGKEGKAFVSRYYAAYIPYRSDYSQLLLLPRRPLSPRQRPRRPRLPPLRRKPM